MRHGLVMPSNLPWKLTLEQTVRLPNQTLQRKQMQIGSLPSVLHGHALLNHGEGKGDTREACGLSSPWARTLHQV